MRLAAKLVLLFLVALLLIVGIFSYLTIQQNRQLAIAEHEKRASDIAATLQPSIQRAIAENKAAEIQQLMSQSAQLISQTRIRWVEFDSAQGNRPSVPRELIVTRRVTTICQPDPTGREFLYTYVPVEVGPDSDRHAGIEIASPNDDANDRIQRSLVSSLVALFCVATLSGLVILVGGFLMVGKPLNQLIEKVHDVGHGDFGQPVQVHSNDELGRLGIAINEMCDQLSQQRSKLQAESATRLATLEQLRHAERLHTVGRLAAGVAHEIGTPLSVVSGRAELIASGQLSDDESKESARTIQAEANRISTIVRQLLDFGRQSTPDRSPQNITELIQSTVNLMKPLLIKQTTKLNAQLPSQAILCNVDAGQIQQVITNLILNAAQSTDEDGQVTITASQVDATRPEDSADVAQKYCQVQIQDNGAGISDEDLQRIFEPFFTTKDVGQGTGLGLSISHGIVQEHGGWIDVQSERGSGSNFSIYLPMVQENDLENV
ncbi:MAG: HAMP domain-containing protein [Pirellulaceae bacterium]|nr:HAMP domain-containing protein [Pirellulaceae bacterium]